MTDRAVCDAGRDDIQRLLEQALSRTVQSLGAYGGGLALVDPDDEVLTVHLGVGLPLEYATPLHRKRLSSATPDPLLEAVRERRLVWIASSEELVRRYPQPARILPHHALAVAPIVTGDTTWGVLLLFWPASRPAVLDPVERHAIEAAAERFGRMLQGAAEAGFRLPPPERPRTLPLPRYPTVSAAECQAAVDYVARLPEGGCALGLDGRIVFLDPTAAELLGGEVGDLVGQKPWEAVPWLRDPRYEQAHRHAVLRQEPVSLTAVRPPDRPLLFQLYPDPTGVSVRISPIPGERRGPNGESSATGTFGTAGVTQADRLPGASMGIDAVYRMIELAGALAQAADVAEVIDCATDHSMLAFGAKGCAILTTESGRLRILSDRGWNPDIFPIFDHMPLTADAPGVVALTAGVPLFFADDEELARMYPALGGMDSGMAAWAYLPLVVSGRPIGACVLGYEWPHRFSEEERIALLSFSALIAQALERARLNESRTRLVHSLQVGLLPPSLPAVPGIELTARYLPAGHGMEIGGDFYDVIPLGPEDVVAFIGDVQGHDASAAALMGHFRTAVHAYALTGADPGQVLADTNRLIADLDPHLLASCLIVRIDLAGLRARVATAGHYPPVLRRPGEAAEIAQIPPGPLLGATTRSSYPVVDLALPTGTVLVMYTDGLVEIPATDPEQNLGGLVAMVDRADGPLEPLADDLVRQGSPYGGRTDDTTVLLLRVTADRRNGHN